MAISKDNVTTDTVPGGKLPPWDVGELPESPQRGWRGWYRLLGPGVLLAGASIGSGEWLAGPGISAQYGGTLLWVASLSIIAQVFCNLEYMRYALYTGEPIFVGFFRTWPGPMFWTVVYILLDFAAIWPFNAANAAVPLAAAFLGHLPGSETVDVLGFIPMTEDKLVDVLGFVIFLTAFIPLIFGGTIYRMLERVMAIKLVIVLAYLSVVAVFMISASTAKEVATGFFRFGSVPLRADTVVAGRHFSVKEHDGTNSFTVKGTMTDGAPEVIEFIAVQSEEKTSFKPKDSLPDELKQRRDALVARAVSLVKGDAFFVEHIEDGTTLQITGIHDREKQVWRAGEFVIKDAQGTRTFDDVEDVPEKYVDRCRALVANQGLERVNLLSYMRKHGRLPDLDWALIAVFAAIAGAGGMSNTLFSNYTREKGWGMGKHVGAIPSAIGGRTIALSHVGMVFRPDAASKLRWRGWMRHILRDQLAIWMFCSFVGMALPCMMSLEFIRNAPVSGPRVAAMAAEGMANRYPDLGGFLWVVTLAIGFLILAPGQVMSGDVISRRWTDIIWIANSSARKLKGHQVKNIYYAILATYCAWGLFTLAVISEPLVILKIAGFLMNIALGFSAWHALYVNRTLLPPECRPNWFMQLGTFLCGLFFLGISGIVISALI